VVTRGRPDLSSAQQLQRLLTKIFRKVRLLRSDSAREAYLRRIVELIFEAGIDRAALRRFVMLVEAEQKEPPHPRDT